MRKIFLILGKCLLILSLMGPVIFALLSSPPRYLVETELKDWLVMWITLVIGFVLCVISGYRSENSTDSMASNLKDSPTMILFKAAKITLIAMASFFALVMLVIGIYYAFFSKYMPVILPILIAIGVFIALIIFGFKYQRNYLKPKQSKHSVSAREVDNDK